MPIVGEDNNLSNNLKSYRDKEPALERPNIEKDGIDLVSKSLDTRSHTKDILLGHTSEDALLESDLLSFQREVRFNNQEFTINTIISNIKYNYLRL